MLFVDDAVIELGQFSFVPALGGTYKITGDALQFIYVVASTLGTNGQFLLGILVAAIHTAVAIVIYRAVTDIVLVH